VVASSLNDETDVFKNDDSFSNGTRDLINPKYLFVQEQNMV